jgi:hypothetical protein
LGTQHGWKPGTVWHGVKRDANPQEN